MFSVPEWYSLTSIKSNEEIYSKEVFLSWISTLNAILPPTLGQDRSLSAVQHGHGAESPGRRPHEGHAGTERTGKGNSESAGRDDPPRAGVVSFRQHRQGRPGAGPEALRQSWTLGRKMSAGNQIAFEGILAELEGSVRLTSLYYLVQIGAFRTETIIFLCICVNTMIFFLNKCTSWI